MIFLDKIREVSVTLLKVERRWVSFIKNI